MMKRAVKPVMIGLQHTPEARMQRLSLLVLVAISLTTAACADPDSSIIVTGHQMMEGSMGDNGLEGCEVPSAIGEGQRSMDIVINLADPVTVAAGFQLGLLMENRLTDSSSYAPIGERQNMRINQNEIEVQAVEVTFDSRGLNTLGSDGELRYDSTGILPTDGNLYMTLPLFFPAEIAEWRDAFAIASGNQSNAIVSGFAEVQVKGRTVGGSKVESNLLTIPVQLCDGCERPSTPICIATE